MYNIACVSSEKRKELAMVGSALVTWVDVVTDVIVLCKWYNEGHTWWFSIGLTIIVFSDIIQGMVFAKDSGFLSGVLHFLGMGSVYELIIWWRSSDRDDDNFIGAKLVESVLEAGPFLCLQLYVLVVEEDYSYTSIVCLALSFMSVGYSGFLINSKDDSIKDEVENSHFFFSLVFIGVFIIDAVLRAFSIALVLKAFDSLGRIFFAICFLTAYVVGIFRMEEFELSVISDWRFVFLQFVGYLVTIID